MSDYRADLWRGEKEPGECIGSHDFSSIEELAECCAHYAEHHPDVEVIVWGLEERSLSDLESSVLDRLVNEIRGIERAMAKMPAKVVDDEIRRRAMGEDAA